jgi:hypothetical protein
MFRDPNRVGPESAETWNRADWGVTVGVALGVVVGVTVVFAVGEVLPYTPGYKNHRVLRTGHLFLVIL